MIFSTAWASAASTRTEVTLWLPVSLSIRMTASFKRCELESASVTASTRGVRAMSNAAAQPIMPAPITRIFMMPFYETKYEYFVEMRALALYILARINRINHYAGLTKPMRLSFGGSHG